MNNGESINNAEIVKTGVEFPKALLKLVQKRVIDRDIKMKDAVREAFVLWLSSPANEGSTRATSVESVGKTPVFSTTPGDIQSFAADLTDIKAKLETLISEVAKGGHGQTGRNTGNQRADESGIDQIVRESDADTRRLEKAQRQRGKADHHGEQMVGRQRPKPKKAS